MCDVRFAHSPGRLDPGYLNSLRAFDVAFVLDVGGGTRAVVGVDTKYHERNKVEQPKPRNAGAQHGGVRSVGRVRPGGSRSSSGGRTWP